MNNLDSIQTFNSLFSLYRFRIPDYQRGYAWGKKEHRELLDDIATLTEDNEHFTGLLVLHENQAPEWRIKTRGMIKPVFDVVDGQQRLTTIVILMNEIRREMAAAELPDLIEIAEDIQENYLYEPGPGSLLVPRLVLDANNRDYFERNILEIGGKNLLGARIQSHNNLLAARHYFAEELHKQQDKLKETYLDWLEGLYRKVNGQLKVMVYLLRTGADAGVVFEAMNSRGKKPNSMDIVKNYLLFLASKLDADSNRQLSENINATWTTIFEQLSASDRAEDEDSLLEYHWMTVYDYDRRRWSAEPEKGDHVKKHFKSLVIDPARHGELFHGVKEYIETLQNAAIAFADLSMPNRTGAFQIYDPQPAIQAEIIKYSEKLLRIGALRSFIPLLLAVRLRMPENAQAYLDIAKLCEQYAFRVFRVASGRVDRSSEAVLFRLGSLLYSQKNSLTVVIQSVQRDLHSRCSDAVFAQNFALDHLNPWYSRGGLKYLLYEYEEHLHGGKKPTINWDTIWGGNKTIEHILPQNPEDGGEWFKRFTPDEAIQYKHTLGNLTLTEDNSKLGRKPFEQKKGKTGQAEACYANSNLKIERELAGLPDWTPHQLEERQKRLTAWAIQRWQVPAPPPLPDDAFEALKQRAHNDGFGAEFMQIHELAQRLKLIPKANKNRMSYKSPRNFLWTALSQYVYSNGISVEIHFKYFPQYAGVPETRIREIFDQKDYWWLTAADQVSGFIDRMDQLLKEVTEQQAK